MKDFVPGINEALISCQSSCGAKGALGHQDHVLMGIGIVDTTGPNKNKNVTGCLHSTQTRPVLSACTKNTIHEPDYLPLAEGSYSKTRKFWASHHEIWPQVNGLGGEAQADGI